MTVGLPETDQKQHGLTVLRFAPMYIASSDLFRNIAVLMFCAAGFHSCPVLSTCFRRLLTAPSTSAHALLSALSPGLLLNPCRSQGFYHSIECHLPALKSMFPTLSRFSVRHSLLDLSFPILAFL